MFTFPSATQAQTCLTPEDMDVPTKTALVATGQRFFDMAAKGDSTTLRQNAIPSLAADFSGIEAAVKDNQGEFLGSQSDAASALLAEGRRYRPD